jgi:hypothetical protein
VAATSDARSGGYEIVLTDGLVLRLPGDFDPERVFQTYWLGGTEMLTLPPSVRIFVCLMPADMRRSLDGLASLPREILKEDPLSGHLFVFFNRRRDRTKVLLRDRSGLCLNPSQYAASRAASVRIHRFSRSNCGRIVSNGSALSMLRRRSYRSQCHTHATFRRTDAGR